MKQEKKNYVGNFLADWRVLFSTLIVLVSNYTATLLFSIEHQKSKFVIKEATANMSEVEALNAILNVTEMVQERNHTSMVTLNLSLDLSLLFYRVCL